MKKAWIIQVFFLYLMVISDEHLTPYKMKFSTKEKIKEAIENYCEGISYLEFSRDNFDAMVDDIARIVESEQNSMKAWEAEYRGERDTFIGDM